MANKRLSVIAPVYIANPYLEEVTEKLLLESLARCEERDSLEVILTDDNSPVREASSKLAQKFRNRGLDVRLLTNPVNKGFPYSVDRGIKESSSDYVAMSNSDVYVPTGSIAGLMNIIERDKKIVGIGPVTNNSGNYMAQQQSDLRISSFDETQIKAIQGIARKFRERSGKLLDVNWLTGFFMIVSKDAYYKTRGMDMNFGLGYYEEVDLCSRLRKLGHLVVDENSFVFHGHPNQKGLFGASMSTVYGNALKHLIRNLLYFRRKNGVLETAKLAYDWYVRRNFSEYLS